MKNKLKIGDEIKVVDIENSPEWLNKKVKIIDELSDETFLVKNIDNNNFRKFKKKKTNENNNGEL